MHIREAGFDDVAILVTLVSEANKDVALRFGLNAENCPKHPSFCDEEWIKADLARGERYFILEENLSAIACVAYERPSADLAYLNRLSVLPAHRECGIGSRLVEFIIELARSEKVEQVSIGVIGEHADLQRWYNKRGFESGEVKCFPHLPFSVRYMAYSV